MSLIFGTDPRTGQPLPFQVSPSTTAEVAEVCETAHVAGARFADLPRDRRAALLDAIADGVEAERAQLVATASAETRAKEIGEAYATSMTVGSGQLCTKPGFVAIPKGAARWKAPEVFAPW
jgi:acyl-CoA reductase-like NAD-dependent aldehyde dehydrogenase